MSIKLPIFQHVLETKRESLGYFDQHLRSVHDHAVELAEFHEQFTVSSGFIISRKRFYQWIRSFLATREIYTFPVFHTQCDRFYKSPVCQLTTYEANCHKVVFKF
jgi:hypothetical protein